MDKVTIGDATLYCGDCLHILPTLPDKSVDAVITDPPYGIGARSGTKSRQRRHKNDYTAFEDSLSYVEDVAVPAIKESLLKTAKGRGIVTPGGKALWLYPKPTVLGGFYSPAAVGMCSWGWQNYHPILFYGKDPRAGLTIQPTVYKLTERAPNIDHPCPKPPKAWEWVVNRGSLDNETILDPFMGSGTTGVACANLGRKFIGIEIEPKYFDIACKRIETAQRQGKLFEAGV